LSGCGADIAAVVASAVTASDSEMNLPSAVSLTGAASSTSNLSSINYSAFSDAGTDYTEQSNDIRYEDGEYPQLDIINGILKIMSFTNATDMVGQGTYKILYDDPFDNGTEKIEAYVEVTRADGASPMYVKFLEVDGNGTDSEVRIVHVKINRGASDESPLGEFEMTMVTLNDDGLGFPSVSDWLEDSESDSDPFYDKMVLKIAPDDSVSGQTNVQFKIEQDGDDYDEYDDITYNKRRLSANLITQGSLDSGYGWLLKEMAVGNNSYSYTDTLYPAFDDKYIADRVGYTTEGTGPGKEGSGMLSYRTQHDETHYQYKLFNTDGSNLDLGSMVSSFGFKKGDKYGYIWSNYDASTYNGGTNEYSGMFDFNGTLSVGDTITDFSDNVYAVSQIDASNGLIDLTNSSNVDITVGGWSTVTIDGDSFYKAADELSPSWSGSGPNQLDDGEQVVVGGANYIVKPITTIRNRKEIGEADYDYSKLDALVTTVSEKAQVVALVDTISDIDSLPSSAGLTFDTSKLDSTYTWYKSIKNSLNDVKLRVIEGETIAE